MQERANPPNHAPVRIAVDIGGTFTDLHVLDGRSGIVHSWKTSTTPADPSIGLMTGVREAAQQFGFELADVGMLLHGTTVATNAVLERKLAKGALITTAGFEDVLEINRHVRRDVYGLAPDPFPTLVSRERRFGVPERVRSDGSVEKALDEGALPQLLSRLDETGAECVAVCLLNSYVNGAHEQRLGAFLAAERPDLPVTLSCDLSPEIREFERMSTTVLNAVLVPVVRAYLARLQSLLGPDGFAPRVLLVQSNGGVCSLATASAQPARLLLSGPSGGVLASERLSHVLDRPNLVAVDMGGTSFDVSVVRDGRVGIVSQGEIDALPVRLPMVEMRTIGAGGGSIAAVDSGGRLTVGPRSAGATPGPVAYGRGGTEPTVTDANLALGRLDPNYFLGGRIRLDMPSTQQALALCVGDSLGLSPEHAAEGILTVANSSLGAAIRLSLFEKGLDPRDFTLLSFGGAGGLHATDVAAEIGIREVVFPREPGTLSAYGILYSDLAHDLARSCLVRAAPASLPAIADVIAALRADAKARLREDGISSADSRIAFTVDMRYADQAFELLIPWDGLEEPDAASLERLVAAFHAAHRSRFSYDDPGARVDIVTLRATAVGLLAKPEAAEPRPNDRPARKGTRQVFEGGAWCEAAIFDREALTSDVTITGPAVVEEAFATHWIARGWQARLGAAGALIAHKS
jgi:N-methylhydantoinase A/oxoprolinase/acetone carboxylase beta subunit